MTGSAGVKAIGIRILSRAPLNRCRGAKWRRCVCSRQEKISGLLTTRAPFVLTTLLGAFVVSYELTVYADDARGMPSLYRALHCNILDVFNEYGVAIMTPAHERDPEQPKIVPRERWYEAPAVSPASKVEP